MILSVQLDGDEKNDETNKPPGLTEDDYPSGIRMLFIVVALVLGIFLMSLDMVRSCFRDSSTNDLKLMGCRSKTIVATAVPRITDEFKGLDKVGWYGAAFFMTFGGMQSTCTQCPPNQVLLRTAYSSLLNHRGKGLQVLSTQDDLSRCYLYF